MQLHEKIKFLRQTKGWSQEEIAERLFMSTSAYGSIERGETDVNFSRLKQIANVFEIDLWNLMALEKGATVNITGTDNINCHNWRAINGSSNELLNDLEKKDLLLAQRDSEIAYLKQQNTDLREMIALLKANS